MTITTILEEVGAVARDESRWQPNMTSQHASTRSNLVLEAARIIAAINRLDQQMWAEVSRQNREKHRAATLVAAAEGVIDA